MKTPSKTSAYPFSGSPGNRRGFALLLTVVILVVLVTVCYTLSARLGSLKQRQQYMVNYQQSRYACDSAMKYILLNAAKVQLKLADRQDEPDFSDLFTMSEDEYNEMITEWALIKAEKAAMEADSLEGDAEGVADSSSNSEMYGDDIYIDPNSIVVPGPYGPDWPLVQEPLEFEIGESKVTITIEDENAKMPLTWAITTSASVNRQARAALETFCEWMQMDIFEIEELQKQADDIGKYKQFTISPKPINYTEKTQVKTTPRTSSSRSTRSRSTRPTTSTRIVRKTRPAIAHATDFAKLLHSSLLDTDKLAWAIPDTGDRYESPLKYMALWGSQRVNINTAPRHVLEAAFTFGGDAMEIAQEIIEMRKEEPFKDMEDLKKRLYGYSDSITKTAPYICMRSKFLSVKVTARTGGATVSSVATVIKEGRAAQRIAVLTN